MCIRDRVLVVDVPPVSSVPADPTVAQLLKLLAERDRLLAERDQLLAERDRVQAEQAELIAALTGRLAELETRLGKHSQNSSQPPSSDAFVKPPPRSLRRQSGRKPGKGPGDPGFRLEPRAHPDEVRIHAPEVCRGCGSALAAASVVGEERRQVFDLPVVALEVVEHRAEQRVCACGTVTAAAFPAAATAPTCYGPGAAALGAYLLGRQHLPVERAAECLADCFGAPVSTGYLAGLLPAAADRLAEFEAVADAELAGSAVVHFDETGGRVAATLWWVHVMCTDRVTLYHLDARRGRTAMDAAGVLPGFTGVAVHDGLAAYRRYRQARPAQARPGRRAAGPAGPAPRRRAALRQRLPGALRQQPGRARRADGEAAAEDLRRLAVGVRCPGVPRGPLLPVHRPQEWPARPRCAPRPVRRPALAAGRGVQPVAALPDQPGEPRHGFTSPAGHRACGNRPTVASLTAAGT